MRTSFIIGFFILAVGELSAVCRRIDPNDSSFPIELQVISAIRNNCEASVSSFFGQNPRPNFSESQIADFCFAAIRQPRLMAVLINSGIGVTKAYPKSEDTRPWCMNAAILEGRIDTVKLLIQAGVNVNYREIMDGMSPLHEAAVANRFEITQLLLKNGAQVNQEFMEVKRQNSGKFPKRGTYPLWITTDYKVAKLLIENGADLNLIDNEGNSALHVAAYHKNGELIRALLETGKFDLHKKNKKGLTALMISKREKNAKVAKLLIQYGAKE